MPSKHIIKAETVINGDGTTTGNALVVGDSAGTPRFTVANNGAISAGTLTTGSVLFAGASGALSQSNADFFWDNTNKRLGIGTATPNERVEIKSTNPDLFVRVESTGITAGEAGLYFRTWDGVAVSANGGFGATNNSYSFQDVLPNSFYFSAGRTNGIAFIAHNAAGVVRFYTGGYALANRRMTIFSDGNIGINTGTTNAGFRLDVNGTARVQERLTISDDSTVTTETCAVITTDTTNANLVIAPNGTGALIADIPDGTATGGNARGDNAVDLQIVRTAATQIASGNRTFLGGGQNNTNAGRQSVLVGGGDNTVSAAKDYPALVGGFTNTNGGDYTFLGGGRFNVINNFFDSTISGGNTNVINASSSTISGGENGRTDLYGQRANASGRFAGNSDAQSSSLTFRRSITGTAITQLFLDGASIQAILALPTGATNARAWRAQIDVVAICATAGGTTVLNDCFMGSYLVGIKRVGTTTSLVGAVNTQNEVSDTSMSTSVVTITADDTNESLKIEFTPPTTADGTTVIRVVATAYLTEVGR